MGLWARLAWGRRTPPAAPPRPLLLTTSSPSFRLGFCACPQVVRPLLSVAMSDPPYMQALKGEYGWMKFGWFRSYHAKYMVDGRFKPVIHVITFVMCLGYLMEYPHLKRTRPRLGGLGGGHGAAPLLPHLLPRRPRLASPRPLLPESRPPTLPHLCPSADAVPVGLCVCSQTRSTPRRRRRRSLRSRAATHTATKAVRLSLSHSRGRGS